MSNTVIDRSTAEEMQAELLRAAALARGNSINVTFAQSYCKSTRRSSRLTDIANEQNSTTDRRSAVTSIKFIPEKFLKQAKACFEWTKEPIIANAVKEPNTGKRPVYSISTVDNLFDDKYQEMQNRDAVRLDYMREIITSTGPVTVPWQRGTVKGYGGWDAFRASCLKLAGEEAVHNPDIFPYEDEHEFVQELELTYEAEVADPTKNIEHLSEFAKALLTDNRVSAATKMFHAAIGDTADCMADAVHKIDSICPPQQFMTVAGMLKGDATNRVGDTLFTLRVDATEARSAGKTEIHIMLESKHDEFIPFRPIKTKPVFTISHTADNPVSTKKLEGLARKVSAKIFAKHDNANEIRYKHVQFEGGSQLQTNTFAFMIERVAILRNYVSAIPRTDFPVLHTAVDNFCDLTTKLNDAAQMSSGKQKDKGLHAIRIARDLCADNVAQLESVLV